MYIYIYIYHEGTGSVRFVSVPDFSKINRSGSVRFHVRFRPVPELNGSVRFGRFGSVSSSFLCHWCRQVRAREPVACTVGKLYARKRASRTHTYSATPSCAIIHAQAHAPVRHPCVLYSCDNDSNSNNGNDDNNNNSNDIE